MKTAVIILSITGAIVWVILIIWLLVWICLKIYYAIRSSTVVDNLIVAYKWYKMPIYELNKMWEQYSRKGYIRIRDNHNLSWVGRDVLVKRIRRYRNKLNKKENGNA